MCARAAGRPRPPPIPRRWREGERERGGREKADGRARAPPAGRDQRPFASPLPVGGGLGLAFGTETPPLGRTRPPVPPPHAHVPIPVFLSQFFNLFHVTFILISAWTCSRLSLPPNFFTLAQILESSKFAERLCGVSVFIESGQLVAKVSAELRDSHPAPFFPVPVSDCTPPAAATLPGSASGDGAGANERRRGRGLQMRGEHAPLNPHHAPPPPSTHTHPPVLPRPDTRLTHPPIHASAPQRVPSPALRYPPCASPNTPYHHRWLGNGINNATRRPCQWPQSAPYSNP